MYFSKQITVLSCFKIQSTLEPMVSVLATSMMASTVLISAEPRSLPLVPSRLLLPVLVQSLGKELATLFQSYLRVTLYWHSSVR